MGCDAGAYFGLCEPPPRREAPGASRPLTGWRRRVFALIKGITVAGIAFAVGGFRALIAVACAGVLVSLVRAAPGRAIRRRSPAVHDALPPGVTGGFAPIVFDGTRWYVVFVCVGAWGLGMYATVLVLRRFEPPLRSPAPPA